MLGIGLGGLGIGAPAWSGSGQVAPTISLTSGSGYAGSVYTSTVAGQWTANGIAISGATGVTYTLTTAAEGTALACGASNTINLPTEFVTITYNGAIVTYGGENVMRAA